MTQTMPQMNGGLDPHAGTQLPSSQPVPGRGTKRHNLVSASDRAEKYRRIEQVGRVLLKAMGFNPRNRSGQGIIPFHMHNNVGPDSIRNKVARNRYGPVRLVEVPPELREL